MCFNGFPLIFCQRQWCQRYKHKACVTSCATGTMTWLQVCAVSRRLIVCLKSCSHLNQPENLFNVLLWATLWMRVFLMIDFQVLRLPQMMNYCIHCLEFLQTEKIEWCCLFIYLFISTVKSIEGCRDRFKQRNAKTMWLKNKTWRLDHSSKIWRHHQSWTSVCALTIAGRYITAADPNVATEILHDGAS